MINFDFILKIGSISGLISIFYQIHNNRKNRPSIKFDFQGSFANIYEEKSINNKSIFYCDYHFQGFFKNISLKPNSIVNLHLTVWENKKRGKVLRFGGGLKFLKDLNNNEIKYLPLRLLPKQAYKLEAIFKIPLSGSIDEKLISSYEKEVTINGVDYYRPKYRYEFIIEDISGNLFDYKSSLINRNLIDLWWTLSSYANKPFMYLIQFFKIIIIFFINFLNKFIEFLGFYK